MYGVTVNSIREIESYDDRNFRVKCTVPNSSEEVTYTLKVHNGVDSEVAAFLESQDAVLRSLHEQDVSVPNPAYEGKFSMVQLPVQDHPEQRHSHAVRLLNWVHGVVMSDVESMPLATLYNAGVFAARMDNALTSFSHPGAYRTHVWDLQNMEGVNAFTFAITDSKLRTNVDAVLADFSTRINPLLQAPALAQEPACRKQVLQNDFNDANVVLTNDEKQVSGVLDFGDMCHTFLVNEVAIGMAYAMVGVYAKQHSNQAGLAAAAVAFYRGFTSILPLQPREKTVVFGLALCRLAMSATLGAYARSKAPENEYLGLHATPAITALELFSDCSPAELECLLDDTVLDLEATA